MPQAQQDEESDRWWICLDVVGKVYSKLVQMSVAVLGTSLQQLPHLANQGRSLRHLARLSSSMYILD